MPAGYGRGKSNNPLTSRALRAPRAPTWRVSSDRTRPDVDRILAAWL